MALTKMFCGMKKFILSPLLALGVVVAACGRPGKVRPATADRGDTTATAVAYGETVPPPPSSDGNASGAVDQSEGMLIIERLTRVYGEAGAPVGAIIGSSRCPGYIEGWHFSGERLVFQVRGDTARARREISQAAGSNHFSIEKVGGKVYSEKELGVMLDTINKRMATAPAEVSDNVYMWGVGLHAIDVHMRLNTEAARLAFRKHVYDSPALRFSGSTGREPCSVTGVADTLGVSIRPESDSFPADARRAAFVLRNHGSLTVGTGEDYRMAVERGGRWYWLPTAGVVNCIGINVGPGGSRTFYGQLYPTVNNNRPGRYRFFKEVSIDGHKVVLMCDFFLSGK